MQRLIIDSMFKEVPVDLIKIRDYLKQFRQEVFLGNYKNITMNDYIVYNHRINLALRLKKRRGCIIKKLISIDSIAKMMKQSVPEHENSL